MACSGRGIDLPEVKWLTPGVLGSLWKWHWDSSSLSQHSFNTCTILGSSCRPLPPLGLELSAVGDCQDPALSPEGETSHTVFTMGLYWYPDTSYEDVGSGGAVAPLSSLSLLRVITNVVICWLQCKNNENQVFVGLLVSDNIYCTSNQLLT